MSLQIWLPLNGDLKNKGVADVTITNNGGNPTYDTGKIGQGLVCNGSKNWKISGITLGSEASIAWWSKTTVDKKMSWVLESTASEKLNMYEKDVYTLNTGDSNNNPFKDGSGNSISVLHDDLWHHFVVTWGSDISKLYIDGVYAGTALTFKDPTCTNSILKLAGDYNGGHSYDWEGMLNDFRVYDHCLSPVEIKEIARGLILHYKFDDPCIGVDFYDYIQSTGTQWIDTGVKGYMNHTYEIDFQQTDTNDYRIWGAFGQSSYIGYNMSLTYKNSPHEWILRWNSTESDQEFYSSGVTIDTNRHTIKIKNGVIYFDGINVGSSSGHDTWYSINYNLFLFTVNPADGTTSANSKCKIYRYKDTDFNGNVVRDMVPCKYNGVAGMWDKVENKFYGNSGTDVFTVGTKITSTKNISDSSGYNRNGAVTGSITITEDTPKHSKAIYMNNNHTINHIEADAIFCDDNVFSISFWLKADKSDDQVILADPKIVISFLNNGLYVCTSSSTPFKTTKFTNNEWNHIVAIRNGDDYSVYINGESISRFGTSNYYTHNASKLWILNRSYNTNYGATAYLSDLRIYSTILSQNDVLELYKVSGKIDDTGKIHSSAIKESLDGKELFDNDFTIISGTDRRYTSFSHEGMEFSGYLSVRSKDYVEITPTSNNYIYDFTVSISAGNNFYIGFERYDADKTSRSNNATYYVISTTPSSDVVKKRYTGILTSALNTDGVNPCKFLRLRILNGWGNSTAGSTKKTTIHQWSIREIPKNTTAKTKLFKTGIFETDLLKENNTKASIEKKNNINVNEFIEI